MAHKTPIDEEVLLRVFARVLGLADKTADADKVGVRAEFDQTVGIGLSGGLAEERFDALFLRACGEVEEYFILACKDEADFGVNEDDAVEVGEEVAQLGLVGFEEFAPDGDIEEEVSDPDIGADGALARLLPDDIGAMYLKQRADLVALPPRGDFDL
jgi:hypothetical protein